MATFHTNGRIISSTGQSIADDPTNKSIQNLNASQVAYGSKILSPNLSSKTNKTTGALVAANINIQSMVQSRSFTTILKFKNPEHDNREIIIGNTLKGDLKQQNEDDLPCVGTNNNQAHPDDPCIICYYGRWTHKNDVDPRRPCGIWVKDKKKCVQKKFPVPPCYSCSSPSGLEYRCKICEQCTDKGCKDICPEGFRCTYDLTSQDFTCKKPCNQEKPCRTGSCYDCVEGHCEYRCGTGEECLFGLCINQGCSPECDPLKCEKCEKISDTEFACVPSYRPYQMCCKGKVLDKLSSNSCFQYNDNCETYNTCPQGEKCLETLCIQTCTFSAECTGPCEYCDDGFCSSLCGHDQICEDNTCKDTSTALKCEKCERPQFKPECTYDQIKSKECWFCLDSCVTDRGAVGKPLKCVKDKQGNYFCSQYDIPITNLSLNIIP